MNTMVPDAFGLCLRGACAWALIGVVGAVLGCSALDPCDTSDDGNPDPYHGGITADGFYVSSDWTGPFLPFTGGKRYELVHGLGCTPQHIECWASFNGEGVENGSTAPSAGNMCVVQDVTNEFILIKNDTCSDMYVRVTAWGCLPDAGVSDASDAGVSDASDEGG